MRNNRFETLLCCRELSKLATQETRSKYQAHELNQTTQGVTWQSWYQTFVNPYGWFKLQFSV